MLSGQLFSSFNGTLHDFKGFQLVIIAVSFYGIVAERYTQNLVKFLWVHLFQDIIKMAGLKPATKDIRSFTGLWSREYFGYVYLQRQS